MNGYQIEKIPFYRHEFSVTGDVLDQNKHVNNVVYVRWMQEVAILHSKISGGTQAMNEVGATWFVKSHRIEYFNQAYKGDDVVALTWVSEIRKIRSLRKYRFFKKKDGKLLATGETEWIFVNALNGRPQKIPQEVENAFQILSPEDEPTGI